MESQAVHDNIVVKDLATRIHPDFTTATIYDIIVSAALMMALLKSYFIYQTQEIYGIPSITLEGTKEDWEQILLHINKLDKFGHEPMAWAALLRLIHPRPICANLRWGREHRILETNRRFSPEMRWPFSLLDGSQHSLYGREAGSGLDPRLTRTRRIQGIYKWAKRIGRWNLEDVRGVAYGYLHVENIPVTFCDTELTILGSSHREDT